MCVCALCATFVFDCKLLGAYQPRFVIPTIVFQRFLFFNSIFVSPHDCEIRFVLHAIVLFAFRSLYVYCVAQSMLNAVLKVEKSYRRVAQAKGKNLIDVCFSKTHEEFPRMRHAVVWRMENIFTFSPSACTAYVHYGIWLNCSFNGPEFALSALFRNAKRQVVYKTLHFTTDSLNSNLWVYFSCDELNELFHSVADVE